MAVVGVVREWWPDEGWGVIDSPATPGGCWAHFSAVLVDGYRALLVGDTVELEFEGGGQEGFGYTAVAVWPAGTAPLRHPVAGGPSGGYRSSLELDLDDDGEGPPQSS